MVDLGGSLAVASRGLFATGVSTDLNGIVPQSPTSYLIAVDVESSVLTFCQSKVTYLNSGGKIGDIIRAVCVSASCHATSLQSF